MKILHTADLHIGGAFAGFPPKVAAEMRRKGVLVFGKIADYAKENGITKFLIAGDLFDTSMPSADMRDAVLSVFRQHSGISFYLINGNHDSDLPLEFRMRLPENVFLFGKGISEYDLGESVSLFASDDETIDAKDLSLNPERTNILMFHAAVGAKIDRCLINPDCFEGKPLDYLALGHYHSYSSGKCGRGEYVIPGTPAARGFDDTGEKGFVVFDTEKRTHEFVPTNESEFFVLTYELKGEEVDISALSDFLLKSGAEKGDYVKLILTGKTSTLRVDCEYIGKRLGSGFGDIRVEDKTAIADEEFGSSALYEEFRNIVLADKELTTDDKNEILRYGYAALKGENVDSL